MKLQRVTGSQRGSSRDLNIPFGAPQKPVESFYRILAGWDELPSYPPVYPPKSGEKCQLASVSADYSAPWWADKSRPGRQLAAQSQGL
jgi:hypothetical protein